MVFVISYEICQAPAMMFSKCVLVTHCSKGLDYGPMALRLKGQRYYILTFVLHALGSSPLRLTEIDIENPATHYLNFAVAVALVDSLLVVMLHPTSPRPIGLSATIARADSQPKSGLSSTMNLTN